MSGACDFDVVHLTDVGELITKSTCLLAGGQVGKF